ncbi:MAG TPA: hypothetical protein VKO43_07100 [Candidatus Krumholzibacteriaceae bacterium]|nr:hypothetical protein [Candidatus Krumholzibacteriaceae bacterium]
MKKFLMIVAVLALVTGAASTSNATVRPTMWITNSDLNPVEGPEGQYGVKCPDGKSYTLYLWVLPDPIKGFTGAEFNMISGTPQDKMTGYTLGEGFDKEIGKPWDTGWIVYGKTTHYSWTLLCTFEMTSVSNDPRSIKIDTSDSTGDFTHVTEFLSADGRYGFDPGNIFTVNGEGVVPTDASSWGAIKSMYH